MKAILTFCNLLVAITISSQTAHIGFSKKKWLVLNPSVVSYGLQEQSFKSWFDKYFAAASDSKITETKDSALPVSIGVKPIPEKITSAIAIQNFFNTSPGGLVTTLAGNMLPGDKNAVGEAALFNFPLAVVADDAGNIYVADAGNNKIKKIKPGGEVSTFAGSGIAGFANGTDHAAFHYPSGLAIDATGNIYVADKGNHRIRKVAPDGLVSTLAGSGTRADIDGPGNLACFDKPVSVAADALGNVYVADQCNNKIRKITPNGMVSTLAGSAKPGSADGFGAEASFKDPAGVAVDMAGNVYVADYGNNRIRKITPAGLVTTLAGSDVVGGNDGFGNDATFYFPTAIAVDGLANVYISDQLNNKIRKLTPAGQVITIAGNGNTGGTDGYGTKASFNSPAGIAVDGAGYVYIADAGNHKIRKIDPTALENSNHKESICLQYVNKPDIIIPALNASWNITHLLLPVFAL